MKVELKNVKFCEWASQETNCFNASIWIDGKRAGKVGNEGHGGCNWYEFKDRKLEQAFYDYCKNLPPIPVSWGDGFMDMNADCHIGDLFTEFMRMKDYKRWCRKQTVFHLKEQPEDEFRVLKIPYGDHAVEWIKRKYGKQVDYILNERI